MNHYRPELANKQLGPLPMQFLLYKLNFIWPLQEQATRQQNVVKLLGITCSLLCYVGTFLAEIAFISEHLDDVPFLSEAITSLLLGIQYFIRIVLLSLRQQEMRQLLKRFYKDIYFTSADDQAFFRLVCVSSRNLSIITNLALLPIFSKLLSITIAVITKGISSPTKPFVLCFSFPWYDEQAPLAYILTTIYTAWYPISFLSLMTAEDYLLCMILLHTSYRYKELQQKIRNMLNDVLQDAERIGEQLDVVHVMFRKRLYHVFQSQQRLDRFVEVAKSHFSFHVFSCISFGVVILCIVAFRLQMSEINPDGLRYILFLLSQTVQFILIGYFGQMLLNVTCAMHESYYMCEWEFLLPHGNARSNNALMKDIKFAILHAERGAVLTGMKMFPLTLPAVFFASKTEALRKAVTYFMFLKTVNDANI